jgi:membrane protein YdbS with pleckstrin-like domain
MINQIPIKIEREYAEASKPEAKRNSNDYSEIEEGRVYKLGNKTFWLFFFIYGKWFVLISILMAAFVYEMYFGSLQTTTDTYLRDSWYNELSKGLLATWIIMVAFSITFVGYLRAYVLYRQYKFHLTENAFHVRRGIFSIKEIVIAYHQIQNVEIRRPYHYRLMGLSKLDISLSNNMPVESHLKGSNQTTLLPVLDRTLAASLAHELVRRGSTFGNDLTNRN